jgi:mevalonate kinase
MESMQFYSHGKLLITAEYLVLDGAEALALPTQKGQLLNVYHQTTPVLSWRSLDDLGNIWFEAQLNLNDIFSKKYEPEDSDVKKTLIEILFFAHQLNPQILIENQGFLVETRLTFPRNWGLGTSSTLINNLAQWFQIDAFELLRLSFGGSGYDLACAQTNAPIIYKKVNNKPFFKEVKFQPPENHLFFVYLNQKQNSKTAIKAYYNKRNQNPKVILEINSITEQVLQTNSFEEMARLLHNHEVIMSDVLELQTIKERFFQDFDGVVKSLGAWGGDFVLAISKENPTSYFKSKGYETVIPYPEMIL